MAVVTSPQTRHVFGQSWATRGSLQRLGKLTEQSPRYTSKHGLDVVKTVGLVVAVDNVLVVGVVLTIVEVGNNGEVG